MQFLAQVVIDPAVFPGVQTESVAYLFATSGFDADNSLPGERAAIIQQKSPHRQPVIVDGPQCEDYYVDDELAVQARVFEATADVVTVPALRDARSPGLGWVPLFRLSETIWLDGVEMSPWILFGLGICDVFLSADGTSGLAQMRPG
jgi:hypothetical protein